MDLVPSDVLASFLLAAAMQRADRGAALKTVLSRNKSAEKLSEADREAAEMTASMLRSPHDSLSSGSFYVFHACQIVSHTHRHK